MKKLEVFVKGKVVLIAILDIPKNELKGYDEYVGELFRNESGVYNICDTVEDVVKSNQWFKNFPVKALVIENNVENISKGTKFVAVCTNKELDGKIFTYIGPEPNAIDVLRLKNEAGEEFLTTTFILDYAFKFIDYADLEIKQAICNINQTKRIHSYHG